MRPRRAGERIREARLRMNLTQEQFAKRVGVQRLAVARYEAGRMPRSEVLVRIANVTGLNINDLVRGGAGDTSKDSRRSPPARARQYMNRITRLLEPDWDTEPW